MINIQNDDDDDDDDDLDQELAEQIYYKSIKFPIQKKYYEIIEKKKSLKYLAMKIKIHTVFTKIVKHLLIYY